MDQDVCTVDFFVNPAGAAEEAGLEEGVGGGGLVDVDVEETVFEEICEGGHVIDGEEVF